MARLMARRLALTSGLTALILLAAACTPKVVAPPEPPMTVTRGDQAFRYEDYAAAVNSYRNYLSETEHGEYTARVFYKTALAEYRLGQYQEALATLEELGRRYPKAHWVQVEALRGDAQRELGRSMMALHAWDAGWQFASDTERAKLRQRISGVARGMNDTDLAKARHVVTSQGVQKVLDRQIAMRQPPGIDEPIPDLGEETEIADASSARSIATAETRKVQASASKTTARTEARRAEKAAKQIAEEEAPAKPTTSTEALGAPPADDPWALPPVAKREEAPPRTTASEAARSPEKVPEVAEARPELDHDDPVRGPVRIGCLLPLTGADEESGQRSLRGLRLLFGADNKGLVVKDTASDPSLATVRFDELVRDPNVVLVIGPLQKGDADSVAPLAEQAHLTTLLLAPHNDANGRFALQASISRAHQVAELLDYAMESMRVRRFGVLYPKDSSGEESMSAFRAAVEQRGGTVVGTDGYTPGNQTAAVGDVKRWRNAQNLQAIFVPDNATAAAPFAHFLQREMPDVPLLGVQSWEALVDHQEGVTLNGIVFADSFYANSTRPGTRDFVNRFVQTFGAIPGVLEAQAYDAALLAKRAVDAGTNSRLDALRRLGKLGNVEGATGTLHFAPAGVQREMYLLQVFDGKLREVGAAG